MPLTLWLVASIISHIGDDYTSMIVWLRSPLAATMMTLLLIAMFHHTVLDLQVVIEDYIHFGVKFTAIIMVRFGSWALAASGILATLHIMLID